MVLGLLLAAGRGKRFDASGVQNKLLAEIDGDAVAVRSARRLLAATGAGIAVLRPGSAQLSQQLSATGLQVIDCAAADQGMGHSLACGASFALQQDPQAALLVALADMPFISEATCAALLERLHSPADIVVPRHQGQRGHPVLFGPAHLQALSLLAGDRGANTLLHSHRITWVDVDDPGILRDIDHPSDLPSRP